MVRAQGRGGGRNSASHWFGGPALSHTIFPCLPCGRPDNSNFVPIANFITTPTYANGVELTHPSIPSKWYDPRPMFLHYNCHTDFVISAGEHSQDPQDVSSPPRKSPQPSPRNRATSTVTTTTTTPKSERSCDLGVCWLHSSRKRRREAGQRHGDGSNPKRLSRSLAVMAVVYWRHVLIYGCSYCKGKDCKKHTLHKVTQCTFKLSSIGNGRCKRRC